MGERRISLEDRIHNLGSPRQLALDICPYNDINLLNVVIAAYRCLKEKNIVDQSWPEDKITRELYVQIQIYVLKKGINTIPVHQYPIYLKKAKKGKPPTIDFVFRKGFQESPYLGFECKIVNDKNTTSIKNYIYEGMFRFLSGKYARNEKVGGMTAYLINCEVLKCVNRINEEILNNDDLTKKDILVINESIIHNFKGLYVSKHNKKKLRDMFLLYHILMQFNT